MRRALRALVVTLLVTAVSVLVAVQPAAAGVQPRCYVVTTYGTGTLTPGQVGEGYGTGTLTLEALYADPENRVPEMFEYTYIDRSNYRSGADVADYSTAMTVNGVPVRVSPHEQHSPGYWLHGEWWGGWRDQSGTFHPWQKWDQITVTVSVQFFPTLRSGWTRGSCTL